MQKVIRVDDRYYEFLPGSQQRKAEHMRFTDMPAAEHFIRRVRAETSDLAALRPILADATQRPGLWQLRSDEFERALALALYNGVIKVRGFRVGWTEGIGPEHEANRPKQPGAGKAAAARAELLAPPGAPPVGPLLAKPGPLAPLGPPGSPVLAALAKPPALPNLAALVPPNPLEVLKNALEDIDAIKADFLDLRVEIDQALVQTFAFQVNLDFATGAIAEMPPQCASVTTAMNAAAAETTKTLSGL